MLHQIKKIKWHWLIIIAVLLHLPSLWSTHFFADDLLQYFSFTPNARLIEQGLIAGQDHGSLAYVINNQFHFFNPDHPSYSALKDSGALPWWLPPDAKIHFWRPLSSLSHWLDYKLWPESVPLMHAHNALLLLIYWIICWRLFNCALAPNVAGLALLLIVLDVSVLFPLDWVAARNSLLLLALAPLFVLALFRSSQWSFIPAWLLYGVGLLIAEAGVALMGFLLAWLALLDKRSWLTRIHTLLWFIALSLLWRTYYQYAGFGAYGVSHYIDPIYSPAQFIDHAFLHFPALLMHLITGAEATDFYIHGQWLYLQAFAAYLLLLLPILAAHYVGVANKAWWFWYLAGLMSLQPYVALSLSDPRISPLSFMAYAVALSMIVVAYFEKSIKGHAIKFFIYPSLLLHGVLSAIALLLWCFLPHTSSDKQDARFNHFAHIAGHEKPVIVANSVDPFRHFYYPFRSAYLQMPVASTVRALMLAHSDVTIKRVSETEFILTQEGGMRLTPDELYQPQSQTVKGVEGMSWLLTGFFHDGDYRFYIGQEFAYPELRIIIDALEQGRPSRMRVLLAQTDVRWLFWDWTSRQYLPMRDIAIGETLILQGKYEYTQ